MAHMCRVVLRIHRVHCAPIVAVFVMLVIGCGPLTRLVMIVPDGYEGFLIVRYQCPGGEPVIRLDGRMIIRFRSNGTACVADSYQDIFPSTVAQIDRVQTASGSAVIPWVIDTTKAQASGFVSISTLQSRQGSGVTIFSEYWVGDMATLRSLVANGHYSEQLAQTYEAVGKQRDGTITIPKPVPAP